MAPPLLYQETFRIRYSESEPGGRASAGALCRFLQETADGHCRTFGMSLAELRGQGMMWVITRLRLQMERYPRTGDSVMVETWASTRTNGIRAIREFRFLDAEGSFLGRAVNIWLMLDLARKRPVRMPALILEIGNAERSDLYEFEIPRLKRPMNPTGTKTFDVFWKDLDGNHHVNNVNYIEWALEAVPLEFRRDRMAAQIDVEFLGEAFYGDRIRSQSESAGQVWVHQLVSESGQVLSLAETHWR